MHPAAIQTNLKLHPMEKCAVLRFDPAHYARPRSRSFNRDVYLAALDQRLGQAKPYSIQAQVFCDTLEDGAWPIRQINAHHRFRIDGPARKAVRIG